MLRFLAALAALVALISLPALALAQAEEAARLKAEGDTLMGDIQYQAALEKYEAAYKLSADPALLYNQGRALEALSRFPDALEKLRAFDAKAPPELHARVPNLTKLIADIEGRTTLLTVVVAQKGATIKLGNVVLGTSPLPETRVNAGAVTLEVTLEGYDAIARELVLPGGAKKSEKFELVPKDKTAILLIDSPVKGAKVRVDEGSAAQVPTEVRVAPGTHVVSLSAPGYDDNTVTVIVGAAERKRVVIEPGESPVYERWWFWTIWGGLLAGAGASVITYAVLTEGPPDEGTIPPGQLTVNGFGRGASGARGGRPSRPAHGELGAGFGIGPLPIVTIQF